MHPWRKVRVILFQVRTRMAQAQNACYTDTKKQNPAFLQVILLTFGWCFTFIIRVPHLSPTFKLSAPTVTLATKTTWPTLLQCCHTKGCGPTGRVLKKRPLYANIFLKAPIESKNNQ